MFGAMHFDLKPSLQTAEPKNSKQTRTRLVKVFVKVPASNTSNMTG